MPNKGLFLSIAIAASVGAALLWSKKPKVGAHMPTTKPEQPQSPGSDFEALSRMLASEVGGSFKEPGATAARIAVGWAAMNAAKARKRSVYAQLVPAGKGYGAQTDGRYASTKATPQALDRKIAGELLAGKHKDPTGGATQWDAPVAQRAALARGVKGYTKTPEEVAASRQAAGQKMVAVAGIPLDKLRMWGKA
jgi:hypothetical protein